jgi:hypothetical protein
VARKVILSGASESEHEGPSESQRGNHLLDKPSRLSEPIGFKHRRLSIPIPMGFGDFLSTSPEFVSRPSHPEGAESLNSP